MSNGYYELNDKKNNEIDNKNSIKNPLDSSVSQEKTIIGIESLEIEEDKQTGEPHDKFWKNDISVLYDSKNLLKFFPTNDMNLAEKLNAVSRLSIYIGLTLFILKEKIIYLSLTVIVFIVTYYIYNNKNNIIENLLAGNDDIFRKSTKDNPFANFNIITGTDKDKIAMPIDNEEVKKEVENNAKGIKGIDNKLFKSTYDVFNTNNAERQFYSMPSTSMPNDQTSFAKWCYSTGPTCKEKNLYCAPNYTSLNDERKM